MGDETPTARLEKRMRPEHLLVTGILAFVGVGGGGLASYRDLAAKLEAQTASQTAALGEIKVTLAELKTQGASREKESAESARELARLAQELRETGKQSERASVRLDELERRMHDMEAKK